MRLRTESELLPEIYNGHSGTHLTIYLPIENECPETIQQELEDILIESEEMLREDLSAAEVEGFLSPIRRLMQMSKLLAAIRRGGCVLFRSATSFRVMRIPRALPRLKVISNSFHVKPILRWLQSTKHSYILSLAEDEIRLYTHARSVSHLLGSVVIPKAFRESYNLANESDRRFPPDLVRWLDEWIIQRVADVGRELIIVGPKDLVESYRRFSIYPSIFEESVFGELKGISTESLAVKIENMLSKKAEDSLKHSLRDLRKAENNGYSEYSVHQVSKALAENELSRIYVAEDQYLWGIMCQKTGDLVLSNRHNNCRDEDVLDDMAELAIRNGVEVILVPSRMLPSGSPIAGIYRKKSRPDRAIIPA